jgi:hypothetical protein
MQLTLLLILWRFFMRVPMLTLVFLFMFVARDVNIDAAVPRRTASDEQVVTGGQMVANGTHIEIYQHEIRVDPSFLKIMEAAYEQVQKATGLALDTATLGAKVRVYVSDAIRVSHVWKGYRHPSDPRGVIFLNARAYHGAMSGDNATYIHELTHLFAWRYNSHTLREGFADYVALTIIPGAAVGPNTAGQSHARISSEILEYLGTTKTPPDWVSTDPGRRSAYYFASYRFVKFLVDSKGMETFMKLYISEQPETDVKSLYGIDREEAVKAALAVKF